MDKKLPHETSENAPLNIKKPIARVLSLRLATVISIVTIFVSISSYLYSITSTEELVGDQLIKFINERGLRESALFLESNAYLTRFQKEYVERYQRMGDEDPVVWFEEHMEKRPEDGTYRSKPELYYGKERELGRRDVSASVLVGSRTKITPEVRRAFAIGYDMVTRYGPAWRKPFLNLYFASPEKIAMDYWPGTPWGLIADDEVEWRNEEWFDITTIEKNPERRHRWSGVLYDERNGNWMVSGVTPLDIGGKQVGLVGTDLLLDDLVERTNHEKLFGTYNILLQEDGRVIVHPDKIEEIIANKGMLMAQSSTDEHLRRIYELAQTVTTFPSVMDNNRDSEFLAVARIQGPEWYFITVYPKSLLASRALRNVGFIFLSGTVSLAALFLVVWLVLKRNLVYPLGRLTQAVRNFEILKGQWPGQTDGFVEEASEISERPDEIGLLAGSFVDMGGHLRATYSELEASRKELESKVATRTESLEKAKNTAEAANRAKSKFLANMSHELRTPLNAILGFTQLLGRDSTIGKEQRDEIYIISRSGQHLLNLINDVLDITKIEAGRATLQEKSFDLYAFLRGISELFHSRAVEKGLTFTLEKDADVPRYIKGDEGKLRQVLINLLGNALKFTEKGGVTLRVKSGDAAESIWTFHFEVEDTGIGIDSKHLEEIFDPFVQTSDGADNKAGTGLGLTISRQFVNLMGGNIEVDSKVNSGSLFRFGVAVGKAEDSEIEDTSRSRRVIGLAPDQPSFRILVVEDLLESRKLLVKLLQTVGFEVKEASDGKQGVELFNSWHPDLIWMDMRMPVMDGYEATKQIKQAEAGGKTIVIALTAHAFEEERQEVLNSGCDDFIRKPYVEEELFTAMEKQLGVRFIYEIQDTYPMNLLESQAEIPTPETLAELPREVKDELLKVTAKLDQKGCLKILEQLYKTNRELASTLRALAENYQFEELENILERKE